MSSSPVVPIPGRQRGLARLSQFINYFFWLLYSLLLIRGILAFFSARSWAGFVRFVDAITSPFFAPFRGILSNQNVAGGFTLAVPILVAIGVYVVLHLAIHQLLRVMAYRSTAV